MPTGQTWEARMSYLYGDSSTSELTLNFIEFLKDAIDFSVQVLVADRHMREGSERGVELNRAAKSEEERLESLRSTVATAVENALIGDAGSATARCAEALLRSSTELVHGEIERVRSRLVVELGHLDDAAARERSSCMQALSTLLLRHDLPDWTVELGLEWRGARYLGLLRAKAPLGLEAAIDLDIGPNHLAAHIVRLDKLVERLEVQAPEEGGWLRKEVKLRPQRLEKEYLTNLQIGATETTFKLRANPDGTGAGFDVSVRAEVPRVRLTRAGENEAPPFELNEVDAARVIDLQEKLLLACADLARLRKAVVEASLDGTPFQHHPNPKLLVERLIETITPTVKEITSRSSSPTELVLKRQIDGGRREEIFVSRDELQQKLAPLDAEQRALFAALGLAEVKPPAAVPAPKAKARAPSSVRAPSAAAASPGGDAFEEIPNTSLVEVPEVPSTTAAPAKPE